VILTTSEWFVLKRAARDAQTHQANEAQAQRDEVAS
jgi:hypothetical protein